jgi:hypothetical protein
MSLLKLVALDAADLPVVSAHLQDAVVSVADLAYSGRDRRFVLLANRFDWTGAAGTRRAGERRRAALRIEGVRHVQTHGIDRDDRSAVLSILAVLFEPAGDAAAAPAGTLTLVCAGDAAIRLSVECVELMLEDLGPAWEASRRPEHPEQ